MDACQRHHFSLVCLVWRPLFSPQKLRGQELRVWRGSRRVMSAASRPEDFDEMVLSARVGRQLHIGDTIALCVQRGGTTYCVSSEGFVELSCSLREVR